jgi:hypothetical protein
MEISKESYAESLRNDISEASWAKRFIETEDWKKLANHIAGHLPTVNPYDIDDINKLKFQGGYVAGMTLPERILTGLIDSGKSAQEELKQNPNAM